MVKTLGQIAMDAWDKADANGLTTSEELFAVAAQAVREAVIEECAKVCEGEHVGGSIDAGACNNDPDEAYNMALRHASEAIRSLKDKK